MSVPNSVGALLNYISESEAVYFPVLCRIILLMGSSVMVVKQDGISGGAVLNNNLPGVGKWIVLLWDRVAMQREVVNKLKVKIL